MREIATSTKLNLQSEEFFFKVIMIMPNSKPASTLDANYYQPEKEMSALAQVGAGYQSDLKNVETWHAACNCL